MSDGAHPVYEFDDVRYVLSLTENMDPERRSTVAQALFGQLWAFHGVAGAWQSISTMWRLAALSGRHGVLQQNVLGPAEPARIEMSFRRLLPVLQYEKVYRLGTARLVGAAMEFGGLAIAMGNANDADQAFQAAAAAAQRLSRLGAAGEAMARLGELRLALALPSPARAAFDVAAQLIEKGGSQGSLNRLGLLKAEVSVLEGQVAEACESLSKAVDGLIQQEDFGHAALGYMRWGRLRYELGLYDEAVDALDKAIHFADESGDGRSVGASRLARAFLMAEKGDLTSAFELLNQAAQAFQQLGLPIGIIEVAAADLQRRGGSPAEAEERFKVAADMFKQANAAIQWADAYHGLGRCRLDQGKFADATKVFDDIEPLRTRARDRFGLVRLFLDQGRARLGTADPVGAFRYACMARELADSAGLGLHLEVASGLVLELAPALDGVSDTTAEAVGREAVSAVRAMEATWNAPPQPKDSSSELH